MEGGSSVGEPENDHIATGVLISGQSLLLTGATHWTSRGGWARATWTLKGGRPDFRFSLDMSVCVPAPASYLVGLRVERDPHAVRLDVRGLHRQPDERITRRTTHLHDVRYGHRDGWVIEPPPDPPFWRAQVPDVTPGEYLESLHATCRYLRIAIRSFTWVHPNDALNQPIVPAA
jgi:hypothetical protein